MSTYGGDSWVPEAQYRKRRVDELIAEEIPDDEVRRMSNGRFACLVCSPCPVLDTMPMLQVHRKGARHRAAAEKQLLKKQRLHDEIQKRIALGKTIGPTVTSVDQRKNASLFTMTKESKAKTLDYRFSSHPETPARTSLAAKGSMSIAAASPSKEEVARMQGGNIGPISRGQGEVPANKQMEQGLQEERKRRQQELRLLESGWKRGGNGGWYRDENVEFDSDEEKPDLPA